MKANKKTKSTASQKKEKKGTLKQQTGDATGIPREIIHATGGSFNLPFTSIEFQLFGDLIID